MDYPYEFDVDEEEELIEEEEIREYEIDFQTGKLTGDIVSGAEAVKIWAWMALQTARFRYMQFSDEYGFDYDDLVGNPCSTELLTSIVTKMLEDCLLQSDYVEELSDITVRKENEHLYVSFTIETVYGNTDLEGVNLEIV